MLSAWPRNRGSVPPAAVVGSPAGSASTSGSIDPSVKAIPDPDVSHSNHRWKKRRSTAKTGEAEAGHAKVSKIADVESAKLRTREVFNVGEDPSSLLLRVGTFNVRTSRAHDGRSWLSRAKDVAREIASRDPGVLAVQELGPGRADGSKGTTTGHLRQTISLERSLKSVVGDSRYQLVRTTPYVKPGTNHGTQGTRILYDTRKFKLLSHSRRRPDRKTTTPRAA